MATYKVYGYDATNIVPVIPSSSDDLQVPGNIVVDGNMTVSGTTSTVDSEVIIADKFVHINGKYQNDTATDAGLIFTVDPEANELNGNINFASSTTFSIAGDETSNFAANDIIQISDAEDSANNGLYQLHSVLFSSPDTTFTIKDSTTNVPNANVTGMVNTSLTTNSDDDTAKIRVAKIGIFRTDQANNDFKIAFGSDASALTFEKILTDADSITASSIAADDITVGDAAVNLTTTVGNITIDAQANDSDIIFKGTDNSVDTTFLTLDGSEGGLAIFNNSIQIADDQYLGNASDPQLLQLANDGSAVFSADIKQITDDSALFFGTDEATVLLHSNGNGLVLAGAESKLAFTQEDFAEAIYSSADGQLDIVAGTEVQIVAPTVDIDASTEVNVSSKLTVGGQLEVVGSVKLTPNAGVGYPFTSDEAFGIGTILYFKSNGKVAKADADSLSTAPVIAVALEAAGGADESKLCNTMYGAIVDVLLVTAETYAQGSAIYLDETAGTATSVAPTGSPGVVLRLGYAYEAGNGSDTLRQIIYAPEFVALN